MTDLIALNKLVASRDNARKTGIADGLEELAASIAAHGLLQSLVVRKTSRGKFAVIAGQRRLLALSMLAEKGSIAADMPIACKVLSKDSDAAEISLAENVVRVPMHPADQFEAFRALIDNGAASADVAARFGVTESLVVKRMKLGRVSPALLSVYREGGMSLERLQAFTVSDDHAAQERVWQDGPAYPGGIRSALTEGEIPSTDRRVRFVGLETYEDAGGEVRRDLFDSGNSGYILDADLLQKLTQDKLAAAVAAVTAEGWQWVELRDSFDWNERSQFSQHRELTPLPADEQTLYDFLTAELDQLEASMNDEEADEDEATSDRIREIAESIERMDDRPAFYPPEIVAQSGAVLFLDYDGELVIERGVTAKAEAPKTDAAGPNKPAADPSGLSAPLAEYLTAQKTAAIRAELAQSPSVALAAVVHALALTVFYRGGGCLEISNSPQFPAIRHQDRRRQQGACHARCRPRQVAGPSAGGFRRSVGLVRRADAGHASGPHGGLRRLYGRCRADQTRRTAWRQLASCRRSASEIGDLRWGVIFFDSAGQRVVSLYFDASGRQGVMDSEAVSFSRQMVNWMEENFANALK